MVSILATQNPEEYLPKQDYQQMDARVDPGVLEFTFDSAKGTLTEERYRAPGSDVAYINRKPYTVKKNLKGLWEMYPVDLRENTLR